MSTFPTRSFSGHMRQQSMSAAAASTGQSPALVARVNEKKAELENLKELRSLSADMASQMEALEQKLATLSDGTEAIALVLANWHNVLRAINMASGMPLSELETDPSGLFSQQQRNYPNQPRMKTETRSFPCHKLSCAYRQSTPRTFRHTRKQQQRKPTSERGLNDRPPTCQHLLVQFWQVGKWSDPMPKPEPMLPSLRRERCGQIWRRLWSNTEGVTRCPYTYRSTERRLGDKVRLSSYRPTCSCAAWEEVGHHLNRLWNASISRSLVSIPPTNSAPRLGGLVEGVRGRPCFEDRSSATHIAFWSLLSHVEPVGEGTCAIYLVSSGDGKEGTKARRKLWITPNRDSRQRQSRHLQSKQERRLLLQHGASVVPAPRCWTGLPTPDQ